MSDAPGVDVLLPDGQELRGRLYARVQRDNGAWAYQVGLVLWQTAESGDAVPGEYRVWVAPERLRPVPGVSYEAVLTQRRPRSRAAAVAEAVAQWPPTSDEWRIQRERRRLGTRLYPTTVHHVACFVSGGVEVLTGEQAREALARPLARACGLCGAERLL
ncbi:DUF6233 domain-containing protein [Streptomyces sp. NPDC047525]|uniref:DUF6233 domain-containing protein n=1 Tax=Streptomyces sp. NPDC047525 TaxID=3155264 RepID=UPI0034009577